MVGQGVPVERQERTGAQESAQKGEEEEGGQVEEPCKDRNSAWVHNDVDDVGDEHGEDVASEEGVETPEDGAVDQLGLG